MTANRLSAQIAFLVEADKLKTIARRTPLVDNSRQENSAEHSWHLALAAMVLSEYAPDGVNVLRVLQLVTVHDLVEIDAGDTFAYDVSGLAGKAERERAAAERIFALLPADQASTAICSVEISTPVTTAPACAKRRARKPTPVPRSRIC